MKPQAADSAVLSVRCAHRSSGGRRCRLSVSDPRSVFCAQHRSEQLEEEAADHFDLLSQNSQGFQTAQGINHSLHNLYTLLAENRISPRRAAVLSHICGLLLRTLPAIDADNEAGITDPTAPLSPTPPNLTNDTTEDTIEITAKTATNSAVEAGTETTMDWDPSIPDPDPTKKPS